MTAERHKILAVVPPATEEALTALGALGAETAFFDPRPSGIGFLSFNRATAALATILKDWRAQTVLGIGPRTMTLAALAARRAGASHIVSLCTGLPAGDLRLAEDATPLRKLAAGLAASNAIVFHNTDDPRRLDALKLLPKDKPLTIVPGAGVDLTHFAAQPLPALGPGLVFLMLAPLDRARGVNDYARAAQELRPRAPSARFLLAGPPGRGADALAPEKLVKSSGVEYLGEVADVRPLLASCHVYVYPSHAEGMPKSVLEALATGRPVVTTHSPGCRATVDEHVNGWLVPAGDVGALAAAMEGYLKRPDLIPAAARASRSKAERQFDDADVVRTLMGVLSLS